MYYCVQVLCLEVLLCQIELIVCLTIYSCLLCACRSQTEKPSYSTTGIHSSIKNSMAITFNVIIPLELWDLKKSGSRVCLRFGHTMLGNWECDIGDFSILRSVCA